jgi:hypothetical protein
VAFSGAILTKIFAVKLDRCVLPYTITLLLVGSLALLLSAKLYERFRWHNDLGYRLRDRINPSLRVLECEANKAMKGEYPFLNWLSLHMIWNCLFAAIALLGIVLTGMILLK